MTINEKAVQFAGSARGRLIISQALYIASREMAKVPSPYREGSNIADMEYLMAEVFPIYPAVAQAERVFKKAQGGGSDEKPAA